MVVERLEQPSRRGIIWRDAALKRIGGELKPRSAALALCW